LFCNALEIMSFFYLAMMQHLQASLVQQFSIAPSFIRKLPGLFLELCKFRDTKPAQAAIIFISLI
jgi:hypothetical protein